MFPTKQNKRSANKIDFERTYFILSNIKVQGIIGSEMFLLLIEVSGAPCW